MGRPQWQANLGLTPVAWLEILRERHPDVTWVPIE